MAAPAMVQGATFEVDTAHTTIGFSIRHMVINNVQGAFREFQGAIEYNEQDPASLSIKGSIKAASVDTGIAARDEHLRSGDFFDVTKYPEITFESTRVSHRDGQLILIGNFTLHGVTQEIRLPLTIAGPITDPQGNVRIGLETSLVLNRKDYGMNWSKVIDNGGLVVGDEVTIQINAEAMHK